MNSKILLLLTSLLISATMYSQNPNFHIYLCFGQSNMEGSAEIQEQDKTVDDRFKMMSSVECTDTDRKLGNWYEALPPLSQCHAGLAPSDYFGRTMVALLPESVSVGVICVAIGGCDIRIFDKDLYQDYDSTYAEDWFTSKVKAYGGNPYDRLIELAKEAQKDGVIKGFLLHQGETNNEDEQWPEYVKTIYNNMLTDLSLKAEDVPLLAGEVVGVDQKGICAAMNPIINKLPAVVPTAYVISSLGCPERGDNIHFNSEGVRKLGRRYAVKMLSLQGVL
jgi:hypothetical protein